MLKYLLIILLGLNCETQNQIQNSFIEQFKNISECPVEIQVSNELPINNNGGHIQGIQLLLAGEKTYAVATGSSDLYSYYLVIKLNTKNEVISVNRLLEKPFKHAGGFQIFEDYMAVGIEDNLAKNKSKVCIYSLSNPEQAVTKPVSVIERDGEPERATAGCVGITKINDEFIIAVGDWNTEHIDFYTCEKGKIENGAFQKVYSINSKEIVKNQWINNNWLAYQNINLFNFNNQIYLIGLGVDNQEQNVADLFILEWKLPDSIQLTKVASKTFSTTKNVSFKAGAGVCLENEKIKIISSGYNTEKKTTINLF